MENKIRFFLKSTAGSAVPHAVWWRVSHDLALCDGSDLLAWGPGTALHCRRELPNLNWSRREREEPQLPCVLPSSSAALPECEGGSFSETAHPHQD